MKGAGSGPLRRAPARVRSALAISAPRRLGRRASPWGASTPVARGLLAAGLLTLMGACGGGQPEPPAPEPPADINVTVINNTETYVTVGASWSRQDPVDRHTVADAAESSYTMAYRDALLAFVVDIGQELSVRTNAVTPEPGDNLRVTVDPPARVVIDRIR